MHFARQYKHFALWALPVLPYLRRRKSMVLHNYGFPIAIAMCAYPMRRLGIPSRWFQHHGECDSSETLQLIFILLSIPFFKASHFFFKLAYSIQQLRLRLACREDFFLKFYDRRVANGSVIDVLQSLRAIERGIQGAEASKDFPHHAIRS